MVSEQADGTFARSVVSRPVTDLPPGDVLLRVAYSALSYKDALSASGNRGVTRRYPHTPGIDAAGVIEESSDAALPPGMTAAVMGYDLGMNTPGGLAEYVRVPAGWVMPLPQGMSAREAMALFCTT